MAQGKAGQIKIMLIGLGLLLLLLVVTGRVPAFMALIGAALTQVMRFAPFLMQFMPSIKKAFGGAANPGGSSQSQVVTNTLKMTLDHATGTMDGEILDGTLSGRTLQSLSVSELQALYAHCEQYDAEAARLLMSFIARERADDWEQETGASPGGNEQASGGGSYQGAHGQSGNSARDSSAMGEKEAMAILGLEEPFSRKDITRSHRQLMGKFHPDKGGNTYLATKLNNARDLLIEKIKNSA